MIGKVREQYLPRQVLFSEIALRAVKSSLRLGEILGSAEGEIAPKVRLRKLFAGRKVNFIRIVLR